VTLLERVRGYMAAPGVKAGGLDQLGQKGGSKPELSHLAKLIKDGKVVNVVVMVSDCPEIQCRDVG
jgi:hypothetical protein